MKPAIARALVLVGKGKEAQHAALGGNMGMIVLLGLLVERGLARTVKHRDHTRSYALTDAGKREHATAVVVAANDAVERAKARSWVTDGCVCPHPPCFCQAGESNAKEQP